MILFSPLVVVWVGVTNGPEHEISRSAVEMSHVLVWYCNSPGFWASDSVPERTALTPLRKCSNLRTTKLHIVIGLETCIHQLHR